MINEIDRHRIQASIKVVDSCWEWQAGFDGKGYGKILVQGKLVGAHRASYRLYHGPIPQGLEVDHICRNTACINPEHLQAITRRENMARARGPRPHTRGPRPHLRQKACARGHELTDENRDSQGRCRACQAAYMKKLRTPEWRRAYREAWKLRDPEGFERHLAKAAAHMRKRRANERAELLRLRDLEAQYKRTLAT
ncbi:unnamed protein product [marine sediment metagenome]|uniref:HNH nuclease domain-containing protein n=1 Tax=marine sediment metagenome TaxID=412755 RepID=X0U8W1_9ZZZZ